MARQFHSSIFIWSIQFTSLLFSTLSFNSALLRALAIKQQQHSSSSSSQDNPEIAHTLEMLARSLWRFFLSLVFMIFLFFSYFHSNSQGKFQQAEHHYNSVLSLKKKMYGNDHWEIARMWPFVCLFCFVLFCLFTSYMCMYGRHSKRSLPNVVVSFFRLFKHNPGQKWQYHVSSRPIGTCRAHRRRNPPNSVTHSWWISFTGIYIRIIICCLLCFSLFSLLLSICCCCHCCCIYRLEWPMTI